MKKVRKTAVALFLCACLLMSGSLRPFFAFTADGDAEEVNETEEKYRDKIEDINDKLDQLAADRKVIEENINKAKSEAEKTRLAKEALDREMGITQSEIGLIYERISVLEEDIAEMAEAIEAKQGDIDEKQNEIDENFGLLRKRLRAMYMQNTTTTFGLLIGSDSFSDFLTRTEYIRRIADHDQELMKTLTDQRIDMENEKLLLEEDKTELEDAKSAVEADRAENEKKKLLLASQVSSAELQLQDAVEMERAFRADLEQNKKTQDAAKAEIDRIYKEIEWSKNAYSEGAMAWPVPGFRTVSCEFGPRFGGADYHTGIDLTGGGIFGHNIVAANSGTVVVANHAYRDGVGYGKYVIIDHGVDSNGNSISTLYGHCSSLSVTVGQVVQKGQVIAQVGSTGWSTGPHLHFEVRVNGNKVNPRPYIFA